jgi:hypothetical protein
MTANIPDYAATIRQGQEAVRAATDAYTTTLKEAFAGLPKFEVPALGTVPTFPDTAATVDGFYDHALKVIEIQRNLVKQLATVGK